MRKMIGIGLLIGSMALGCASVYASSQTHSDTAIKSARERAPFDLGCDNPELMRLGDVNFFSQTFTQVTVGAKCGDKRATYVVTCVSNWGNVTCTPELNSAIQN